MNKFFLFIITGLIAGCADSNFDLSKTPTDSAFKICNGFAQNTRGQSLLWKSNFPIELSLHKSLPQHFHGPVQRAVNSWNNSIGSEVFKVSAEIAESDTAKKDGLNVIYWITRWADEDSQIEATTQLYWTENQINEADILINAQNHRFATEPKNGEIDFESLMVHELGHVLGLGHVEDDRSVMTSSLANGIIRREPSKMDLQNLNCRYQ